MRRAESPVSRKLSLVGFSPPTMTAVLLNSKVTKVLIAAFCIFFLLRAFLSQRDHASELLTRWHRGSSSRRRVVDDRSLASIRNETLGVSIPSV